jgi:hypothetical protein
MQLLDDTLVPLEDVVCTALHQLGAAAGTQQQGQAGAGGAGVAAAGPGGSAAEGPGSGAAAAGDGQAIDAWLAVSRVQEALLRVRELLAAPA